MEKWWVGRQTIVLLIKRKSVGTCGRKDYYGQVHFLVSDLNKKIVEMVNVSQFLERCHASGYRPTRII